MKIAVVPSMATIECQNGETIMHALASRAAVSLILMFLVCRTADANWALMNGGYPVDGGQTVIDWASVSTSGMPLLQIPNATGPDDLVYLFKAGTHTHMGRLKGQGAQWEVWTFDKVGGKYASDLPATWSADVDVLPVPLDNGAWHDTQMRLVHDPGDAGTTFFGFSNARIKMGTGHIDDHSYTHGVRFDGQYCLRWTSGTDWQLRAAGQVAENTLWGQWMGPGGGGRGVTGFDYDRRTGRGILLSQWAPGDMHSSALLAAYRFTHGIDDTWEKWNGGAWVSPSGVPACVPMPVPPQPNGGDPYQDWLHSNWLNTLTMAQWCPIVTCIPHCGDTGLQAGLNFLVTFLYSPQCNVWRTWYPNVITHYQQHPPLPFDLQPAPFVLASALYHESGGAAQWLWWNGTGWVDDQLACNGWDWYKYEPKQWWSGATYANLDSAVTAANSYTAYRPTVGKSDGTVHQFYQIGSQLRYVKYDHGSLLWSTPVAVPVSLMQSGAGHSFVVGLGADGKIRIACLQTAESIGLTMENGQGGWTSPELIHTAPTGQSIRLQAMGFAGGGNVPTVFFLSGTEASNSRLYCVSDDSDPFWSGQNQVCRLAPPAPVGLGNEALAVDQRSEQSAGFPAFDKDGWLFLPHFDCEVAILDAGWPVAGSTYHWGISQDLAGQSFSILSGPMAVAVNNEAPLDSAPESPTHGGVYVADRMLNSCYQIGQRGVVQRFHRKKRTHTFNYIDYNPANPERPYYAFDSSIADGIDPDKRCNIATDLHRNGGLAVDELQGILYVVESGENLIRRYDVGSLDETVVPDPLRLGDIGPSIAGLSGALAFPQGIAVDDSGCIYVVDSGNHRVVKLDSAGQYVRTWGSIGRGAEEFFYPYAIAIDGTNHRAYVTDPHNKRIQVFGLDGSFVSQWGQYVYGGVQDFHSATGIAVHGSTLFVGSMISSYDAPSGVNQTWFDLAPPLRVHNTSREPDAHYITIQDAVDDAQNGDTLVVDAGVYREAVDFGSKSLTLQSATPADPAATVIDALGSGTVVRLGAAGSVLRGFTVTGGDGGAEGVGGIGGNGSASLIESCVITGNGGAVGGIQNCGGVIRDCTISDNSGTTSGGLWRCTGLIENCRIIGNSGYAGGGLSECPGPIRNCLIVGNSGGVLGGAAVAAGGQAAYCLMVNCTIVGSQGPAIGAVYVSQNASLSLTNCIVWGSMNAFGSVVAQGATLTVSHCDFEGGEDAVLLQHATAIVNYEDQTNLNLDPLFIDRDGPDDQIGTWADNDYRLCHLDSPCIDAGASGDYIGQRDMDNDRRLPCGDVVDIGADEATLPGDGDADGEVSVLDIVAAVDAFGTMSGDPLWDARYDLDCDGQVSVLDIALTVNHFSFNINCGPLEGMLAGGGESLSTEALESEAEAVSRVLDFLDEHELTDEVDPAALDRLRAICDQQ